MDPAKLQELTDSILTYGIIQPLLVMEDVGQDGKTVYTLIAGERRLRAAKAAGLESVPVTVRQSTPQELLEIAIVENVQRHDLNPLEEAAAYQRLIEEFGLTQQQVAERVGQVPHRDREHAAPRRPPVEVRASISSGDISEGHGRALLGLPDEARQVQALERVLKDALSVRRRRRWCASGPARRLASRGRRSRPTAVRRRSRLASSRRCSSHARDEGVAPSRGEGSRDGDDPLLQRRRPHRDP
jgi:ParB family transcriptional regulator, chromosome partitioning protein